MSKKLDPRLTFIQQQQTNSERVEAVESMRMSFAPGPKPKPNQVDVLVRCHKMQGTKQRKSVEQKLTNLGLHIHATADGPGYVVTGRIALDQLEGLTREDWVAEIEASQQLYPDLDISGVDVGVRPLQTVPPTVRGTNTLVGVIDGGIDFRHDDFRHPDGRSRILFLWDQRLPAVAGSTSNVAYGREFTKADIDAVLLGTSGATPVNHQDAGGHGTHVAGIAAGNGRASNGQFMGMAPEADLIIVALRGDGRTLGDSGTAVAACQYIVDRANELQRPVAINMSLGNNGGGHSGESQLEVTMDGLSRLPGVVFVKSAGNEQGWRIHASGTLTQDATIRKQFDSPGANSQNDIFEIWYDAEDQIEIAVQAPGAAAPTASDFVARDAMNTFATVAGNAVHIDATNVDAGDTGDVRAMVIISRGSATRIQPGRWSLYFKGTAITHGRFDVWIERAARGPGIAEQARFTSADEDPTATISIPGTARRIITVGSYVTRFSDDAPLGELSRFSSRGPSRYGLRKPEIAAPGESIVSALSSASSDPPFQTGYTLMPGTSMAAPHVAGAAALVLQVQPGWNCSQVKQVLMRAARRTGAAMAAPDDEWGNGRLDIQQAVTLARTAQFPVVSNVTITGSVLSWDTDIPTTGAVRFNTLPHKRRLLLGRALGSRVSMTTATHHSIDLAGLTAGDYCCEILAFSAVPEEWQTLDDNNGLHYVVTV